LQIVNILLSVNHGKTIAFVKNKAISAGALIPNGNELSIQPHTPLGTARPSPIHRGPQMMGEVPGTAAGQDSGTGQTPIRPPWPRPW
jgi:membrane-bound serine protease (ClpP class)